MPMPRHMQKFKVRAVRRYRVIFKSGSEFDWASYTAHYGVNEFWCRAAAEAVKILPNRQLWPLPHARQKLLLSIAVAILLPVSRTA